MWKHRIKNYRIFATSNDEIAAEIKSDAQAGKGLSEKGKKVRLESGFYGMKIISEATAFEAALDHAFEYRGKLNEIEEKLGRG